jgi:hypothetical protein
MKLSILVPSMHTPTSVRTRKVFLTCLTENTHTDYELLLSVHDAEDAYACLNRLAQQASGEYLAMLSDDFYVAPGWDVPLLEAADPNTLVIGMLVESGLSPVHEAQVKHFFGGTPEDFDRPSFEAFVVGQPVIDLPIWGQPYLIHREAFLDAGGFDTALLGMDMGTMLDHYFWRRWLDSGKAVKRAAGFAYHLMRFTSRDYEFGKRRDA